MSYPKQLQLFSWACQLCLAFGVGAVITVLVAVELRKIPHPLIPNDSQLRRLSGNRSPTDYSVPMKWPCNVPLEWPDGGKPRTYFSSWGISHEEWDWYPETVLREARMYRHDADTHG